MLRDPSAGPSYASRHSWYIPASIALLLFLGGVAAMWWLLDIDPILKDFLMDGMGRLWGGHARDGDSPPFGIIGSVRRSGHTR